MAFREKAAWASLLITLVLWGGYFLFVGGQIASGQPDGAAILERFTRTVIFSVVVTIVVTIVLAAVSRHDANAPADERERLIELGSTSAAYTVLVIGAVAVALSAPILAQGGLDLFPGDPAADVALLTANGILLAVVAAEVVREGLRILRYRLGR